MRIFNKPLLLLRPVYCGDFRCGSTSGTCSVTLFGCQFLGSRMYTWDNPHLGWMNDLCIFIAF